MIKGFQKELREAKRKHPTFCQSLPRGSCVIAEEFGEMNQSLNDWLESKDEVDFGRIRTEALHVLVTVTRFIEELDKNGKKEML